MKKIKNSIIMLMVVIILTTICSPIANASYFDLPYTYTFKDGKEIKYAFDDNGNSYSFINGEKVNIALPLDRYEITDADVLAELNSIFNTNSSNMAKVAPPTSYYSFYISSSNNLVSANTYTQAVNYADITIDVNTQYLKPYASHNQIVLRTTNLKTNTSLNKKIKYSFWYYDSSYAKWYGQTNEANCNSGIPHGYLTTYDFIMFSFIKTSNIKSFTANIWTTA